MSLNPEDLGLRPAPIPVRVAPLEQRRTEAPLEVEGRFAASRAALIKSPSSGALDGPLFALGDAVEAGAVIAKVGEPMARSRLLASEANAEQLRGQLAEREDQLLAAKGRSEPPERLAAFEAKVRAVRHKLGHEELQRKRLALLLESLAVRAPFDARISAVHVSPGASVMSGNPLLELVDIDPIVLVVEVPAFAARRCPPGFEVEVTARGDETPRRGRVSRWSPTAADEVRRLLIDVENPDGRLAAGERGVATLSIGARDTWFAPRSALLHDKKTTRLQLVEHNRVLVRRVRTFGGDNHRVEVAGRFAGSRLVVLEAERHLEEEAEVVIRGDH